MNWTGPKIWATITHDHELKISKNMSQIHELNWTERKWSAISFIFSHLCTRGTIKSGKYHNLYLYNSNSKITWGKIHKTYYVNCSKTCIPHKRSALNAGNFEVFKVTRSYDTSFERSYQFLKAKEVYMGIAVIWSMVQS